MPLYEYECPGGHIFELRQGIDATVAVRCPECERRAVRRVSAFSFSFANGKPSNEGVSKVNPKARRVRV